MRIIFITASLLALAACATPPAPAPVAATAAPQAVASADPARIVCHRETATGSTISHSVCERADAVQDHQLATDLANEAMRNRQIVVHAAGG